MKVAARPRSAADAPRAAVAPSSPPRSFAPAFDVHREPTWEDGTAAEVAERLYIERCFVDREEAAYRRRIASAEANERALFAVHLSAEEAATAMSEEQRRALRALEADFAPGSDTVTEIEDELRAAIASAERETVITMALAEEIRVRDAAREATASSFRARLRADREALMSQMVALEAEESRLRGQSLEEYLKQAVPDLRPSPERAGKRSTVIIAHVAREIADIVTKGSAAMQTSAAALSDVPRCVAESRRSESLPGPW